MNEDRATRYQRLKRHNAIAKGAWLGVLLFLLMLTGLSVTLRNAAASAAGVIGAGAPSSTPSVIVYTTLVVVLLEVGLLPLAWRGDVMIERRYGFAVTSGTVWLVDWFKGVLVSAGTAAIVAAIAFGCITAFGSHWWWVAGGLLGGLTLVVAHLAPVVILPLFSHIEPLDNDELRARLNRLTIRAGTPVVGIYTWRLGHDGARARAALAGLGSSRRILVSDAMLSAYSPEEIEVVLAHELAHHVHGDIWRALAVELLVLMVAAYSASLMLPTWVQAFGLVSSADVAVLPMLALTLGAVSVVMLPFVHALSRAHERHADRFALALTKNPSAFGSALRRLGAQHLADDAPSLLVKWWFYSHPPMRERLASAEMMLRR